MTTATRPFGFWTATALIVGGMIGSGIFALPVALAPFGWTSVLAWAISIAGVLCIGWSIARLTTAMPEQTGVIAITGAVLGPMPGMLVGWSYWVSCWTTNAAIAIAATSYLAVLMPGLNATPVTGAAVSVALLWLLTLLNLRGARVAGRFQVVTTLLKLIPLIAVVAILIAIVGGGTASAPPLPPRETVIIGLSAAITLTLFPLLGFEAAGVAAARVRDRARTIVRATMIGTALTGLLYIIVCSAIVLTLPVDRLAASNAPFELFVETYWARGPALAISAFAAVAAIGALNGWVLVQGEVPLGMARAGLLPGWFARVSARDVPVRVLILSTSLASLLILFNASKSLSDVFRFAALLTTCANLWLYAAICVAALARRIAVPTSIVGLPFTIWAMWGAGIDASALSLALMLTALPLYFMRSRRAAEQAA